MDVAESGATLAGGDALDVEPGYRLAWAGREMAEDERLTLREQIFDPLSRVRRGMVERGWRCLEVGAGRGSMVLRLAEQGPAGRVVATDIDVSYLRRLDVPNLEVVEHNIAGELIGPDDAHYDDARALYNAIIDKRRSRRAPTRPTWGIRPGRAGLLAAAVGEDK